MIPFQYEFDIEEYNLIKKENEDLKREVERLNHQVYSLKRRLLFYLNTDKRISNPKLKIFKAKSIQSYDRKRFALRKVILNEPNVSKYIYVSDKSGALEKATVDNICDCRAVFLWKDPFELEKIF